MDIEILANRLLEYALNENATEYDRQVMEDAVHELSRLLTEKNLAENRAERRRRNNAALKSENEKLRDELENYRNNHCAEGGCAAEKDRDLVIAENEKLRAELEQVKRALAMMWYAYDNKDGEFPHEYEIEAMQTAEEVLGPWAECMPKYLKRED